MRRFLEVDFSGGIELSSDLVPFVGDDDTLSMVIVNELGWPLDPLAVSSSRLRRSNPSTSRTEAQNHSQLGDSSKEVNGGAPP